MRCLPLKVYQLDYQLFLLKPINCFKKLIIIAITGKSDIYLDTQHPQGQAGLEKVKEVDDAYASKYQRQLSGPEKEFSKPVWTTPLGPEFSLGEATPLHLEATVEPKNDPNLKLEWFFNGKTLEHGMFF